MRRSLQLLMAAAAALSLFGAMAVAVRGVPQWRTESPPPATDANSYEAIADAMFGPLVIPFEVLGVLLTAIMIGALVIARPLGVHGREESAFIHPNLAEREPDRPAPAVATEDAGSPAPPTAPAPTQEAAP